MVTFYIFPNTREASSWYRYHNAWLGSEEEQPDSWPLFQDSLMYSRCFLIALFLLAASRGLVGSVCLTYHQHHLPIEERLLALCLASQDGLGRSP